MASFALSLLATLFSSFVFPRLFLYSSTVLSSSCRSAVKEEEKSGGRDQTRSISHYYKCLPATDIDKQTPASVTLKLKVIKKLM